MDEGMRYSVCIMLHPFCITLNRKDTTITPKGESRDSQATDTAVKPRPLATASVSWRSGPYTCSIPTRPQMPADMNMVRSTIFLTGMPA